VAFEHGLDARIGSGVVRHLCGHVGFDGRGNGTAPPVGRSGLTRDGWTIITAGGGWLSTKKR